MKNTERALDNGEHVHERASAKGVVRLIMLSGVGIACFVTCAAYRHLPTAAEGGASEQIKRRLEYPAIADTIVADAVGRLATPRPGVAEGRSRDAVKADAHRIIANAYERISARRSRSAADTERQLNLMRKSLLQDPSSSTAAVIDFLKTRKDAPTGLPFRVGEGGRLSCTPSFRVALLDILGELDTGAAAVHAAKVFERKDAADEWAVALRDLARWHCDRPNQPEVIARLEEMIRHRPWSEQPTVGFLNALDIAVHCDATHLMPELSDFMSPDRNDGLPYAAFLAVDRMAMRRPEATLNFLLTNPDTLSEQPFARAGYFARADVRCAAQRAAVENYLLRADLAGGERSKFIELFPNFNQAMSYNLLTPNVSLDRSWMAENDLAAMECVRAWLSDLRFAHIRPDLELLARRLQMHAASARRAGLL